MTLFKLETIHRASKCGNARSCHPRNTSHIDYKGYDGEKFPVIIIFIDILELKLKIMGLI